MSNAPRVFRVFDTETTGLSHHYDQIIQFAGIAVDENLEYIEGDEILMDIRLRPDVVPSPMAFAIHGIDLNRLKRSPLNEFEAAAHIQNWMMKTPNSMLSGFNSQSFDDEVVRNTMYRNMLDPYEHEWRNSNSRLDVYRLILFVYALRPETIEWPVNDEGKISLKLGDLCKANGIELEHAHDARFDVVATIELMRVIKNNNPKIWDFFLKLSDKHEAKRQVESRKPLVMVERFLPRDQSHMTMVLPLIYDSKIGTKMLCIDLRNDPTETLGLSAEELKRRCLTPVADLADGEEIRSIRSITTNKQPMIADLNVLRDRNDVVERAGLDIEACLKHAEMINKAGNDFRKRVQEAFESDFPPCQDVYEGLYQLGFIERDEHALRAKTRKLSSHEVAREGKKVEVFIPDLSSLNIVDLSEMKTRDRLRMFELGTRAKWANYNRLALRNPNVDTVELEAWIEHMDKSWNAGPYSEGDKRNNLTSFNQQMDEVKARFALDDHLEKVLEDLNKHVLQVVAHHEKVKAGYQRLLAVQTRGETAEKDDAANDRQQGKPVAENPEKPLRTADKKESSMKNLKAAADKNKDIKATQEKTTEVSDASDSVDDFRSAIESLVKEKTKRVNKNEDSPSP